MATARATNLANLRGRRGEPELSLLDEDVDEEEEDEEEAEEEAEEDKETETSPCSPVADVTAASIPLDAPAPEGDTPAFLLEPREVLARRRPSSCRPPPTAKLSPPPPSSDKSETAVISGPLASGDTIGRGRATGERKGREGPGKGREGAAAGIHPRPDTKFPPLPSEPSPTDMAGRPADQTTRGPDNPEDPAEEKITCPDTGTCGAEQ